MIAAFSNGVAANVPVTLYNAQAVSLDISDRVLNSAGNAAYDADVTVAPAVGNNLIFTQQPSSTGVAGTALSTQPVLAVRDAYNNIRTNDNTTKVTFSAINGLGYLNGTLTQTASSGLATFSGLSYNVGDTMNILAANTTLFNSHTTDADFNAGTKSGVVVTGTGDASSVILSSMGYPAGVTVEERLIRQNCAGYSNCYTSLVAWEDGEDGTGNRDLVAENKIAVAKIDGAWTAADTTAVAIGGWTTDATRYIKIYTTAAARHSGKWNTGKYRLEISNNYRPFVNLEDYVRIDGLQISNDTAVDYGVGMLHRPNGGSTSTDVRIFNNIIRRTSANASMSGIDFNYGGLYKVWNNIIYDFSGSGIMFFNGFGTSTAYVYNNTLYNNTYSAINVASGNSVAAKNNIVYGSGSTNAYIGTFAAGTDYNATDGTDNIGQGANNKISQTFSFVDAVNKDFHLCRRRHREPKTPARI